MFSIVGNRIYLHEREDSSFRVMYKDKSDRLSNFKAEDSLTFTIKDMKNKLVLSRSATSLKINDSDCIVMRFYASDYKIMPKGDYIYTLTLNTGVDTNHILIDKAFINVLEGLVDPELGDEFTPHRLISLNDSDKTYLKNKPLICKFDYEEIQVEETGTLIMFDRALQKPALPDIDDDPSDDTLILFSELGENEDESDDTLILF